MRDRLIAYLKSHPQMLNLFWKTTAIVLKIWSRFIPLNKKRIVFASFGGRKFDDSPKALYDKICDTSFFDDWELVWAFVNPNQYDIPRGEKIKIDTLTFFYVLLSSKIWISNSGMARGIEIHRPEIIEVETWHGTPLKKIGGEENQNSMAPDRAKHNRGKLDNKTIRCSQSEYDRDIFSRVFHADKASILLCDLPRNDILLNYSAERTKVVKQILGIPEEKKVILYIPTYREYSVDNHNNIIIAPPIDFEKWETILGSEYVLLFRAHYSVKRVLNIKESNFLVDVTDYPYINDLYIVSDMLISDYSSAFFDFSILERPMLCFAYDLEEYSEKRGLYLELSDALPCSIDRTEDDLLRHIIQMDYVSCVHKAKVFHKKYSPYAGNASNAVVDAIIERC